jgi:hypothetical protein
MNREHIINQRQDFILFLLYIHIRVINSEERSPSPECDREIPNFL